jgi:integrase
MVLMICYSAGLRISEAVHLKVRDIDSQRMQIRVEQGKGKKDRYTLLSTTLLDELRRYWRLYHPYEWLFTGRMPDQALTVTGVQRAFVKAKKNMYHQACICSFAATQFCYSPSGVRHRYICYPAVTGSFKFKNHKRLSSPAASKH